ncbi:uncharacterized protein FOMMEDRAFT_94828, partial [Fomitiporia mediterranea MF3/22]|uniref:uncharacterized protein n=1 Tax=Fomitiporia mediterranea (strain MF3/22) TaxID=694068 RepID=UPI00044094E6
KSRAYQNLAYKCWEHFQACGKREELDETIALQRSALCFLPDGHCDFSDELHRLALYLGKRYDRWRRMEDLEEAIALDRAALTLRPEGHPDRSLSLENLALSLYNRYKQSRRSEDLEESIELCRAALTLRPEGHPDRSLSLDNLALSLQDRYQQGRQSEDLEESIKLYRAALILRPEGHPDRYHSIENLAYSLYDRYEQSRQVEDLEEVIILHRAALIFRPEGHPDRSLSMEHLAISLQDRYQQNRQLEDLEESIELHRATLTLLPEGHLDRSHSLGSLANSLFNRYEQSGRSEDLEELIELYRATLILQPEGHPDRSHSLSSLAGFLHDRHKHGGQSMDLEEAVKMFRAALPLLPESHPDRSQSLNGLANSLDTRYKQSGRSEDLEEAIEMHRAALLLRPEGHPDRFNSLGDLAVSLYYRYRQTNRPEDLEEMIELERAALFLCTEGHPNQWVSLTNLASYLGTRYQRDGRSEDIEESIQLHRHALTLNLEDHPGRPYSLANLATALRARFKRSKQPEDIEESIKMSRTALTLLSEGDQILSHSLDNLARSLYERYTYSPQLDTLEESIGLHHAALNLCHEGHPEHAYSLHRLTHPLFSLFEKLGDKDNFEECMRLLEEAAGHAFSSSLDRLEAAQRWTYLARSHDHHTALQAYTQAISLLQRTLIVNPTLHARHDFLVRNNEFRSFASAAASYAIEKNKPGQAVELLEQGRALLWSQMRGFRTPLDQLAEVNKELVDSFRSVSRQLEDLATSSETPHASFILTEEQERLVERIRRIPGFENFLMGVPFKTLRLSASEGPVIVVNHCEYRSDALIVLSQEDCPTVCVPMDSNFYRDSTDLCKNLLETRKNYGADSLEYDRILRHTMEVLWNRMVSKVVNKLKELGIAEGSRIWWCPTSVLTSLPFHAAGPFKDADGNTKYLLDIYVSSYTPTLGALIKARSGDNFEEPTVLVIGDDSLSSARGEIRNIRNCGISTNLLLKTASRGAVIRALRKTAWVHFVCHGNLDSKPFESSFKLPVLEQGLEQDRRQNQKLTLLDIIQADLPNAEFAYLSACHTAEQPHDSAHDEVLHLAAAMQFSGFRSVIGSMWEFLDKDGPFMARTIYEHMWECGEGEARHKRAAAGLCKAAIELRALPDVQTERWVNLVHIGA